MAKFRIEKSRGGPPVHKPNVIVTGVVALVAAMTLSGCAGQQPSQGAANPTPTPVVAAEATPSATPSPTPSPTASPTPSPTPDPTPNAAVTQWNQFESHRSAADQRLDTLLTTYAQLKDTDLKRQEATVKKLRTWTKSEKTWLKSHPAVACYKPTFDHYSRAVLAYDKAALVLLDAYRSYRESKFFEGYDALEAAEALVIKANGSTAMSEAACAAGL
jgi:hypothetical protein